MKEQTAKTIRCILPLFVLFLIILSFNTSAQSGRTYQMGWRQWEPYQFKVNQSRLTGLDIDMVRAIMEVAKTPISFEEVPWKRHLVEVEAGRIDMAMGASKTKKREVWAYFSDPYRTESVVLYIKKGTGGKWRFKHIQDIQYTDFKLCATRGFYYGEEYEKLKKNDAFMSHVGEVTTENQCYMMLKKGYIDGFIADPVGATTTLRKENLLDDVEIILTVHSNDIHIMFSKQSTSLQFVRTFNQSLAELKSRGKYFDILGSYLSLNKPTPQKKSEPQNTVAVTQSLPPEKSKELSEAAMAFNALRLRRNLREGVEGEAVGHLQKILNVLGYYTGPINGFFTTDLSAAIRKFQMENNLIPDGIVGPLTYQALGSRI